MGLQLEERVSLLGSEVPRVWTPPLRELTEETSLGFEVIRFAEETLGIDLLPWQKWLFIHGLELKPDGSYRFRTILTLVARQNGKTTALNILTLWRMVMDGALVVVGTSTNLDYARQSWLSTVDMAKNSPEIADEFRWPETRTNGREQLEMKNGAFYKIATASRKGGRSLAVDLLILDELREHKTWEAWSASSKTTNARPRGQRWAISNMGDDLSVVLNFLQDKALRVIAGEIVDPSLAIFEWSGTPGCDTADRSEWPRANPALGHTITEDAIASDHTTDTEEVFRTEVLCQRVDTLEPLPIHPRDWARMAMNRRKVPAAPPVFGLSVSPEFKSAAIGSAVMASKRVAHLELADHRDGVDWFVARCVELKQRHKKIRFAAVASGQIASLLPDLFKAGIEPELFQPTDLGKAYGHLHSRVEDATVTHSGDPLFEAAMAGAVKRDVGEGLWSLGWRKTFSDLTPIESVTIGLWLLQLRPSYDLLKSVY